MSNSLPLTLDTCLYRVLGGIGDAGSVTKSSPGRGEASGKSDLANSVAHSANTLKKFMIKTVKKLQTCDAQSGS